MIEPKYYKVLISYVADSKPGDHVVNSDSEETPSSEETKKHFWQKKYKTGLMGTTSHAERIIATTHKDVSNYILEKLGLGEGKGDETISINLEDVVNKTITLRITQLIDEEVVLTPESLKDLTKDQKSTIHAPTRS
jgi:hypothetical protein